MTADSDNNLFGRTINPLNRLLTAGGSTGGEGALIAMRGSILGFGTDLAGSIRIPSLCNGIYGFKPSSCLIPFSGQRIPFPPGWEEIGIIASAGPLATSVRSCSFALETIIKSVPADMCSGTLRFPWNVDMASIRAVDKSRLRIGLVLDDGLSTPTPPMRRALHESVEKLEKAGVQIVPFQLPLVREMNEVIGELFALDGSKVHIFLALYCRLRLTYLAPAWSTGIQERTTSSICRKHWSSHSRAIKNY
jgi:amidase